jgi:phage tail tape-measure protein
MSLAKPKKSAKPKKTSGAGKKAGAAMGKAAGSKVGAALGTEFGPVGMAIGSKIGGAVGEQFGAIAGDAFESHGMSKLPNTMPNPMSMMKSFASMAKLIMKPVKAIVPGMDMNNPAMPKPSSPS